MMIYFRVEKFLSFYRVNVKHGCLLNFQSLIISSGSIPLKVKNTSMFLSVVHNFKERAYVWIVKLVQKWRKKTKQQLQLLRKTHSKTEAESNANLVGYFVFGN